MRLGIRGRIFGVSFLIILTIGVISGVVIEQRLRGMLEEQIESQLYRDALLSREVLLREPGFGELSATDPLVGRLARATGSRLTIIDQDGQVLGDSELDRVQVENVESHANRPEIRAALDSGRGVSRRFSTTLGEDLLYVAVRYEHAGRRGVLRAAMPLREVEVMVSQLRLALFFIGLLGIGIAIVVVRLASHYTARRLRMLVDHAREVRGGTSRQINVSSADEFGRIAGSFNKMAKELDQTLESLAHERNRLETILESMSEGVIVVDGDNCVTLINKTALEHLGLEEPPIGRPVSETIMVPKFIDLVNDPDSRNGGAEVELDIPGERWLRFLARARPLRYQGGCVVVMHDVTKARRIEKIRRDFVANVSHELRTPVSVVQANAETLLDGALDDRKIAATFLEAILRNAQRLSHIISDLLDLSQIEAGSYSLEIGPVSVRNVIRRSMESVQTIAMDKNLELKNEISDDVYCFADETALDQIVVNLVENATKYTLPDGHIEAHARERGGVVRIEIRDDGPGVKAKYRARIFERFYRVDKGRSREMGGTGLGLSITKHLVENLGGEIGVEPNHPKGAIFWFTLPAAEEHSEPRGVLRQTAKSSRPVPSSGQ